MSDIDFDFDFETDSNDDSISLTSVDFGGVATVVPLDKYWEGVSEGNAGSFGNAEMQMAAAAYFNEGDVGNDTWINARHLPFGDYGDENIGVYANTIMLFAYEDHPEVTPYAREDINTTWGDEDPALKWAIEEYNALSPDDPAQSEQREQLADFIADARRYKEIINEDSFVAVPDWAIDSLNHALSIGVSFDPKILPESGEPSALRSRPVSVCSLPAPHEVAKFYNIEDPYYIDATSEREWCFAIVDGEKKMGPFGPSIGHLNLLRPVNYEHGPTFKAERSQQLVELLTEHGFNVSKTYDGTNYHYQIDLARKFDTIQAAQNAYALMAKEINSEAAFSSALLTHRETLLSDIRREAFIESAKKLWLEDQRMSAYNFLLQSLDVNHLNETSLADIKAVLSDDHMATLWGSVINKVDKDTYLLQVRKAWGWDTISITKDKELSDMWRQAKSEDIPFFLADPATRMKMVPPSSMLADDIELLPEALQAHQEFEVLETASNHISQLHLSDERIQDIINHFNAGHRVKTILSRSTRNTSWLITQIPLTTGELNITRQALAMLGKEVIRQRLANPGLNAIAFKKLQLALRSRLSSWSLSDTDLTMETIRRIADGKLDIWFDVDIKPINFSKTQLDSYVKHGYILSNEVNSGKYVVPVIRFNYVCDRHDDVFNICANFKPSEDNILAARRIINNLEPQL